MRFVFALLGAATFAAHAQEPTRAEADSMQTKIDRVAATTDAPPRPANASPLRTTFTEREINAYLALDGPEFLPPGIAVPKTVAQELLRFYTTTPERPRGFAFDEPFALPAGLRAVDVERGAATVTQ